MTAAKESSYVLTAMTFASQDKAVNWAYHVARTGQRHTRVRKDGRMPRPWQVYATPLRSAAGDSPIVDAGPENDSD